MAQQQKPNKFVHPSATKLDDPLKTAGTQNVSKYAPNVGLF